MSDRRDSNALGNIASYLVAGVLHALIVAVMLINFTPSDNARKVEAFDAEKIDIMVARSVNEDQLQQTREEIKEKDRAKKRKREQEEKRLRDLQQKAEQEQQRLDELELQNQLAKEQERERVIALEKKKAEEKKQKELQEQLEKEQREKENHEAERKRKQREAELKKLEEEKKKKQEELRKLEEQRKQQEEFQRRVREEEELRRRLELDEQQRRAAAVQQAAAQRTATVISKYSKLIKEAVDAKWRVPPGTEAWRKARMNIRLSGTGEVLSVTIVESSGSPTFDENAQIAAKQASPVPFPKPEEDAEAHRKLQSVFVNIAK